MAIPLYVPEEYGPEPATNGNGSACAAGYNAGNGNENNNTNLSMRQIVCLMVDRLLGKIKSNNTAANNATVEDNNNNTNGYVNLHEIRKKRRRHPAGPNGLPDLIQCHATTGTAMLEPLELICNSFKHVPLVDDELDEEISYGYGYGCEIEQKIEMKLKIKFPEQAITIGSQLRQIADEIEVEFSQKNYTKISKIESSSSKSSFSWPSLMLAGTCLASMVSVPIILMKLGK